MAAWENRASAARAPTGAAVEGLRPLLACPLLENESVGAAANGGRAETAHAPAQGSLTGHFVSPVAGSSHAVRRPAAEPAEDERSAKSARNASTMTDVDGERMSAATRSARAKTAVAVEAAPARSTKCTACGWLFESDEGLAEHVNLRHVPLSAWSPGASFAMAQNVRGLAGLLPNGNA
jgi:hypothetical protein